MVKSLLSDIEQLGKNAFIIKRILFHFLNHGYDTIANIAKALNLSVPTVNKFLEEMTALNLVKKQGKLETGGGRHPSFYDLNPEACYFGGVDIKKSSLTMAVIDLCGNIVAKRENIKYAVANTSESLDHLCELIKTFLAESQIPVIKIINVSVNISGRVNSRTGSSYSMFNFCDKPLADIMTQKIGTPMSIDNDTRAMTFGEYTYHKANKVKNMLFINVSWGIGIGIVLGGQLYSGKSGFAGEIGHMVTYDNEIICHCGKKGCLETEASGRALHRKLSQRLDAGANSLIADKYHTKGEISLEDILDAVRREDLLCIELVEDVGRELGRWLAGMINIFNPEIVVVGGMLSETGDYLLQPISVAMRRYSLNMVNKDTQIDLSHLGADAGVVGACGLARNKVFEDIFA